MLADRLPSSCSPAQRDRIVALAKWISSLRYGATRRMIIEHFPEFYGELGTKREWNNAGVIVGRDLRTLAFALPHAFDIPKSWPHDGSGQVHKLQGFEETDIGLYCIVDDVAFWVLFDPEKCGACGKPSFFVVPSYGARASCTYCHTRRAR